MYVLAGFIKKYNFTLLIYPFLLYNRSMKLQKIVFASLMVAALGGLAGCHKNDKIQTISETELFTIPYGKFEEQLNVADLNKVGNVRFGIAMQDGFFYIVNGDSKKIMELNSYGDLLTLFYNEDSEIAKLLENSRRPDMSNHHPVSYPFDYPGPIAVDSNKNIYAVCSIPADRHEQSDDGDMLYGQTVLRFSRADGGVEFIGQQGPGGTPFPFIKNVYTTVKDELVVICSSKNGMIAYWFGADGFLKYMVPVLTENVPRIEGIDDNSDVYYTIQNVIPDPSSYRLYVQVDYFSSYIDEDSRVQAGIDYIETLLYPVDIEEGNCVFKDPVSVPPYEKSVVADYSRLTYEIPYNFLGVTASGWKFFILKTDDGFNIQMLQEESQKMIRRQFKANHHNILFDTMALSKDGILIGLYLEKNQARVVWYRTDKLIDAVLNK